MGDILFLMPPPKNWERMLKDVMEEEDFFDVNILPYDRKDEVIPLIDVVVGGVIDEEFISRAKRLKFIQVPYAGVDNIDFKKIKERNIVVANAHENAITVAEHGFTLLLSLVKKIIPWDRDLRYGIWHGWVNKEPLAEVYGKTIGIIGLGSIGIEMAKRAKCFGMRVLATKKHPEKNLDKIRPFVDEIYPSQEMDKVIEKSHFIFVSVPLTGETRNLIGEREFSLMEGKYFINVSRGGVVDEESLFKALETKKLKGAALDTWYIYPKKGNFSFPSKYPIHRFDNVIMSPHTAGYTYESIERNWRFSFRNIIRFLKGEDIENRVDPDLMY